MDTESLSGLAQFGERLGDSRTVQENVVLAGNLLAKPLATLRARQAELEVVRARLRKGESSPDYARRVEEADTATLAVSRLGAEIGRLSLSAPASDNSTVAVYGYVTDGDRPVTSGEVGLMDGNKAVARAVLGKDGSFSLTASSPVPLTLRVATKRTGAEAYVDPAPINAPGPLASYRLIDLSSPSRKAAAGGQPASGPNANRRSAAAGGGASLAAGSTADRSGARTAAAATAPPATDVSGGTLNQGLKKLGERGAVISSIRVTPADAAAPRIGSVSSDSTTGEVALQVHARSTDAAKLDVLAAVLAHDPTAAPIGMTSFDSARTWLKDKKVKTISDAGTIARSPIGELRQRFKLSTKMAAVLKQALTSALGKINYQDQE